MQRELVQAMVKLITKDNVRELQQETTAIFGIMSKQTLAQNIRNDLVDELSDSIFDRICELTDTNKNL